MEILRVIGIVIFAINAILPWITKSDAKVSNTLGWMCAIIWVL